MVVSQCPWPMDPACQTDAWNDLSPEVRQRALLLASNTLARLVGYRVGNCPITVRPYQPTCQAFFGYMDLTTVPGPYIGADGLWRNSYCGCGNDPRIMSLAAPVGRVDQVKVSGIVVDSDDYRIDSQRWLVYTGPGASPWVHRQDIALNDDQPGTMSVTYLNAQPVDSMGAYAVGLLAVEFGKACSGKGKCELPASVTQVVRQGVTMNLPGGMFPGGQTGIKLVDTYIGLMNPKNLPEAPRVWSPDMQQYRVFNTPVDPTFDGGSP